jgi:hypothetical protein
MVLSSLQAFSAKQTGEISWDVYIHIPLARLTGVRHEEDDSRNVEDIHPNLRYTEPFGHSIWMWSEHMDTINNTSAIEAVFEAYRHETLDDVKALFTLLEGEGLPGSGVTSLSRRLWRRKPKVLMRTRIQRLSMFCNSLKISRSFVQSTSRTGLDPVEGAL